MGLTPEGFVVVVDDDEDTRLLVAEIARIAGYSCVSCGNFPQAKEAISAGPAAVLLDIVMPDQLCIRVAAFIADEFPSLPVVLMSVASAADMERTSHKLRALGVKIAALLPKPFWVDQLLEAMATVLPNVSPDSGLLDTES